MSVTDLKFYRSFRQSPETFQEVLDNEFRQTNIFSSHGLFASSHIPPMRQSLSRQLPDKTFHLSRPVLLHGFCSTDLSGKPPRYRSMSPLPAAQTLSHGHEKHRIPLDSCRGQRTKRLAHICRLRLFSNPDCQKTIQQRTLRSRSETDSLCSGCYDNRPLPLHVSVGKLPKKQERSKASYSSGFARQHCSVYSYLRRQTTRCKRLRSSACRSRGLPYHGSRLSGFFQAALALTNSGILCNSLKIKFQVPAIIFSHGRSNNRSHMRSNHPACWILFCKSLSRQTPANQISRCRDRQDTYISDKQFHAASAHNFPALQAPMAGRTLLQMDQTKPAHQKFLWHIRKCGENTNLDCCICLRSCCHHQKTPQHTDQPLYNVTNFECHYIRQNAFNSIAYRDRFIVDTRQHEQPTEFIQFLTGH